MRVIGMIGKPADSNLNFNDTPRDSIDMISSIRSQSKVVAKDITRTAGAKISTNQQRNFSSNKYLLWNQHEGMLEEDLRDKQQDIEFDQSIT